MDLFCPFCSEKITPGTTRCPSCEIAYNPQTLNFLKNLAMKLPDEYSGDRRKHVRLFKYFKIVYQTPEALIDSYLSDISTGGLFIETDDPLRRGETFNIKIALPDGKEEFEALCEVVWTRGQERTTPEEKCSPGMGVKFVDLSQGHIARIISAISQATVHGA